MDDSNNKKTISLEELLALDEENHIQQTSIPRPKKGKLAKEELAVVKKENKYYLPVLNLNHTEMWDSQPLSARTHFTPEVADQTCLSNCCGTPGVWSACCRLDPDDLEHVLGPVSEEWIKSILRHFNKKGFNWTRGDIVIDFEEGKMIGAKFFNDHPVFKREASYPILRIQSIGNAYGCKFLNPENGKCGIYTRRPSMCSGYYCQYVKKNFLVKTKEKPKRKA